MRPVLIPANVTHLALFGDIARRPSSLGASHGHQPFTGSSARIGGVSRAVLLTDGWTRSALTHKRSQDFVWGCTFSWKKLTTFLVVDSV